MDAFVAGKLFQKEELRKFNSCRIAMETITLADIVGASGQRAKKRAFDGLKEKINASQYIWRE